MRFQIDKTMVQRYTMTTEKAYRSFLPDANKWFEASCKKLSFTPDGGPGRPAPFTDMAARIEHTLLRVDAAAVDVTRLCVEARENRFRSVCCLPRDVAKCSRLLEDTGVLVVTVLNFPLAGSSLEMVDFECRKVIEDGADEVDLVIDVRSLKEGKLIAVRNGISSVVETAGGRPVKVILETGLLRPEEIVEGVVCSEAAGAAYVKTSTGFGPRGASEEDVVLMRHIVGDRLGVKASGGIRETVFARRLVELGADLLGTSAGPKLIA